MDRTLIDHDYFHIIYAYFIVHMRTIEYHWETYKHTRPTYSVGKEENNWILNELPNAFKINGLNPFRYIELVQIDIEKTVEHGAST